jgi:hypothetical protein
MDGLFDFQKLYKIGEGARLIQGANEVIGANYGVTTTFLKPY